MRKSLFRRPAWKLALCLGTLTSMPLAAQPEALLSGINRNVGATTANGPPPNFTTQHEAGEACDGSDLGGQTCQGRAKPSGSSEAAGSRTPADRS